jgi:hypothetical protein
MKLKFKYAAVPILWVICCLLIVSCRKNQPICSGNCVDINVNGRIYLKTTNASFSNVPVEVIWFINSLCWGCTSYTVASGKTDSDGRFNFNATIDTTYFRKYFLAVRIPRDSNYLSAPGEGGVNFIEKRIWNFTPNDLENLKVEYYPKTQLTIRLHRVLSDNFDYFGVGHNFTNEYGYGDYTNSGPRFSTDSTLRVETAADIYTRITWNKNVNSQIHSQTDSLLCTTSGLNVFDIYY